MAIMTKEQFQASIRARKPMNVWFLGRRLTISPHSPSGGQLQRSFQGL